MIADADNATPRQAQLAGDPAQANNDRCSDRGGIARWDDRVLGRDKHVYLGDGQGVRFRLWDRVDVYP